MAVQEKALEGFRISPQQRRLWRLRREGDLFSSQIALAIQGPLDPGVLREAFDQLATRHEVLRTRLVSGAGLSLPLQVVERASSPRWEELDLSGLPAGEAEARLGRRMEEAGREQIDPSELSLCRLDLARLAADRHVLVITLPALLADGPSLIRIAEELALFYAGLEPEPEPIQYADYAEWQIELLQGSGEEMREAAQALAGRSPLVLPFELPSESSAAFAPLSMDRSPTSLDATPELLLAAWCALLGRLTGRTDLTVAARFDGRDHPELAGGIGLFSRWVPLSCRPEARIPFDLFLEQVRQAVQGAADLSSSFVWSDGDFPEIGFGIDEEPDRIEAGEVAFSILDRRSICDRFHLELTWLRRGGRWTARWLWDPARFRREDVERLAAWYETLLASAAPETPLGDLALLSGDAQRELDAMDRAAAPGAVHRLFEEQARRAPDAPAVTCGGTTLSYAELEARANRLAHHLIALGAGAETPVGICLERSQEAIVALLAVLKAGGAYVPLEPGQPGARLAAALEDAAVPLVVTQESLCAGLSRWTGVRLVSIDGEREEIGHRPAEPPRVEVDGSQLAYVIFTSGSTGRPKGVAVEHRQLLNYVYGVRERLGLPAGASFATVSTLAADLGHTAVFPALCGGGHLHVMPADQVADPPALARLFRNRPVDGLKIVPSHLRSLLASVEAADLLPRRCLVLGGEACPRELVERVRELAPGCRVLNHYGPTETTVGVLTHEPGPAAAADPRWATVPLGRPLAGSRIRILDGEMRLVPPWVPGELYIGGAGLSRGYVGRPDLTAGRFVPDPLAVEPGARLYRTGDQARMVSGGLVEFLGRIDQQVKIRGFRVELEEVRAALVRHPEVQDGTAVLRSGHDGQSALVAFYVAPRPIPARELRERMAETLPEEVLPGFFVHLPRLPLNANGKLDTAALPPLEEIQSRASTAPAAPRTAVEEALAVLWAEVLGLERVGIGDRFFDLGGHSLLATRLIARAQEELGVAVPLRVFLEEPTVAGMAVAVARIKAGREAEGAPAGELPVLVPCLEDRFEPFPLNEVQQAYWVGRMEAFELGNVSTHTYFEFEREGLDLGRFEAALRQLIERHDMLRAVVLPDGTQRVLERVPPYEVRVLDLRGRTPEEAESALAAVREEMAGHILASDRWPLFDFRVSLFDGGRVRLHISRDALIFDAWSAALLFSEWARLYRDPAAELPPLGMTFRDYVLAEREFQASEPYARALDYWLRRLPALAPAPDLPLARNPATLEKPRFVHRGGRLDPESWQRLKRRAARAGLTPSGLIAAAFAEVLGTWSKSPRFTLNLTLFHRLPLHPQVEAVVGDFTSMVLLEIDPRADAPFELRARRVQERLWEDLEHRDVSGVRVLRELARVQRRAPGALMPVVLTSLLAAGDPERDCDRRELLGEMVWGVAVTSQVWLDHSVMEQDGALVFNWNAVEELFPPGLLDDAFAAYSVFLRRLADREEAWREVFPQLLPAAHIALYEAANATAALVPWGLLQDPFLARAAEWPDRPAVLASGLALTYGELARLSSRLAHGLRALGARPNQLVAVVMEKGWEQVAAVLGILGAGAAYLPVDPALPRERRFYLLRQGQAELALTQPGLVERLEWPEGVRPIPVDLHSFAAEPETPPPAVQRPLDLAYVLFTSGSTGQPKGVMIDHRGALNTVVDVNSRFAVGPDDRVLALSALGFDLSVYDVFGLLAAGGAVVFPEAGALRDPARWAELIERFGVTVWNSVPALMEMLVEHGAGAEAGLASLRLVLLSGDWIPLTLPERIRTRAIGARVISLGGATEASIWSILFPVERVEPVWPSIPYGRPMVNQSFHVLDDRLEPRPVWVPGQLHIGGIGLAQGYWRDEEKTRASFFDHPRTGARLYRTGDLGRWLPDGTIEFLGREDHQVKIQGHRIELGEIEASLLEHPLVQAAVVAPRGEDRNRRRLVAYVVPARGVAPTRRSVSPSLTSPGERLAFKLRRPGLRRLPEESPTLPLPAPPLDEERRAAYERRRTHRAFSNRPVSLASLGRVLGALAQLRRPESPLAKYRYPSAGHLYPVQAYLWVRPGRIEGLEGGAYYHDPAANRLVRLPDGAPVHRGLFAANNRPIFDQAAFVLFLAAPLDRVTPMYGALARDFCLLEAGSLGQLLMMEAPAAGLGFCPVGTVRSDDLHAALDLAEGHVFLHALLGGGAAADGDVAAPQTHEPGDASEEALFAGPPPVPPVELLTSEAERLRLKLSQPGLRRFGEERPTVPLELPADEERGALYEVRRSHRRFVEETVPQSDLGRFLSCLRPVPRPGSPLPKLLYPSAGDLYPVQVYLHAAPGRLEGIEGGTWYCDPESGRLVRVGDGVAADALAASNRGIFKGAALALFLVADLAAVEPMYGALARDFCLLEAGYLSQLLMTEAPAARLGLCPFGTARFEALRGPLALEEGRHHFLHGLLGGRIPPAAERLAVWRGESDAPPEPALEALAAAPSTLADLGEELRGFLRGKLPEYMVPASVVALEALPLTANGKVDRGALPDPAGAREPEPGSAAAGGGAASATEELLARIWAEVLKVDRVGPDDDFFRLGGHSLPAVQIAVRIRELFQVELPLPVIFEAARLGELARRVEEALREGRSAMPLLERAPRDRPLPLSFAQERQWFLAQLDPDGSIYNHPAAARLRGRLDLAALERSLTEIARRHEILRTTYELRDGRPAQVIAPPRPVRVPVADLGGLPAELREAEAALQVAAETLRPFDLARGPVMRSGLLRLGPEEHLLLFTLHHVAGDHWSGGVLVRELAALYEAFAAGRPSPLPELPLQFADFAAWQRRCWLRQDVLGSHLGYWRRQLAGAPPLLELPLDRPRPPVQRFEGARLPFELSPELSERFRDLVHRSGVTLFMGLLAGLQTLLAHLSGEDDVVVGSPVAGRDHAEAEGMIGCFINALALRTDLSGDPPFSEVLSRVRRVTLGAYAHRELPFEKLVEELEPRRDPAYPPVFQVVFNFQSAPMPPLTLPGLTLDLVEIDTGRAKYDFTLYLGERDGRLKGALEYNVSLFERRTAERLLRQLESLLGRVAGEPEVRLSELGRFLTEQDKEQTSMMQKELDQANLGKLRGIRRKAVSAAQDLVRTELLAPDQPLPLVVRPNLEGVDLASWVRGNLGWIEEKLHQHGAILCRGFAVDSPAVFEEVVNAITPELINYVEGSSPRILVTDKVYTSTEYPPEYFVSMHNELSYAHRWPSRIYFYCAVEPAEGGETPIADSRAVLARLPPGIRERFTAKRVRYLRNLHGGAGAGLAWQTVFETDDRERVEAYCREGNIRFQWTEDGGLRTSQDRPAVVTHPRTGEKVWFNQVDQWHPSNLEEDIARALLATTAEEDLPIHATFADGTPLDPADLDAVREAFRECRVVFPWQQGDVLIADNTLVAHGRMPFRHPRRILVAMGGTVSLQDVGETV